MSRIRSQSVHGNRLACSGPDLLKAGVITLLITATVFGCNSSGGGGGGNPMTAPPPPQAVDISGDWPSGSCTLTGATGNNCFSRLFRALKDIPLSATLTVQQTAGNITRFTFMLTGGTGPIGPYSGTIDAAGNVRVEIPAGSLGPGFVDICPDTLEVFTVQQTSSVITGTATTVNLSLNLREVYELSQNGQFMHRIVVQKRILGSR